MPKSYFWLTNQSAATRSVDFVTTRIILALIAPLFVLLPLWIFCESVRQKTLAKNVGPVGIFIIKVVKSKLYEMFMGQKSSTLRLETVNLVSFRWRKYSKQRGSGIYFFAFWIMLIIRKWHYFTMLYICIQHRVAKTLQPSSRRIPSYLKTFLEILWYHACSWYFLKTKES